MYHIEQTKTGFAVWNEGDPGIIFMEEPGLFSWIENSEGITITGYKGNYLEIIIPEIIDGKPVTKIGARALSYCKTLKRVKIPESVTAIGVQAFYLSNSLTDISIPSSLTQIGDHAFCHCASLRRVELPDSLKTIGDAAFYNCRSLTEVTIPRSVTEIGTAAFSYCASLEVIAVAQDNPVYRSEGGYLYNSDYTGLIHCPAGKTGTVSIRQGVTCLEWGAFKGCGKLMEIRIPDSVKEISGEAFRDCSSLRNITIPDSVTRIGSNVFEGCSLLTRIVIPRGVVSVDASTFQGCTNLTDIEAVTENPVFVSVDGLLYHKHYSALVCCPPGKTGSVRILSGVERIWSQAFQDCHRITSVEIPYSVTYAWWNSFHYCSSLTEVRASEWFKVHFADCFMGSPWFKSQGWIEAGFFEDSTWILQADDTLRMVCDGDMGDYDAAKILWKGWKKVKDRVR
ncbi:MAG: leucine-rich repeat domain-containing protein, partial [Lachnospiraceae bacterium]|nr:leucine-rich repeat domain-containing protein [Lachnospiraceae bacterium]